MMLRTMLLGKIHHVRVTGRNQEYEGSIMLGWDLLRAVSSFMCGRSIAPLVLKRMRSRGPPRAVAN
jgi:hypothetical protein